jgi:hypothetical protein
MKKFGRHIALSTLFYLLASLTFSVGQASANTLCNNGTISKSSGRGTCSWNGGIAGGTSSNRNNGYGYSDPWGSSSSTKKNNYGYSDPWGSTSSTKKNNYGYSDPWGSSSNKSKFCSYIDRSKGRC